MIDRLYRYAITFGIVLMMLPVVLCALLENIDPTALLVAFLLVSVAAYFIRKHRKPHRTRPRKLAGVERKPVVPRWEDRR